MSEPILDRTPSPAGERIHWGDAPQQFADLRRPEGDGPHPAVIVIHGGYWRNRYSLDYMGHACKALTAQGAVTWNLEYRRVGDEGGGWPGTMKDIIAGTHYLFDHAEELGVDANKVIVLGHSAGGHFASWLTSLQSTPDTPEANQPSPLLAAVSLAGVLDLHRAWELHLSDDAVVELLGGTPEQAPERYIATSPVAMVPPRTPQFVLHGQNDESVPIELSQRYAQAVTSAGGVATMLAIPNADHFDVVDPESPVWPEIASLVRALLI